MRKSLKILAIVLMVITMVMASTQFVFAKTAGEIAGDIGNGVQIESNDKLVTMAKKILGLIQGAAVILTVILVAVFGFKFILGSAEEKAGYQKSFIPLIVGLIVVFSASSIGQLLLSIAS